MKKRLSALLAGVLSIAMLGSVCAFAAETDEIAPRVIYQEETSKTNTVSFGNHTFDIYTNAYHGGGVCNAAVWILPDAYVPAGTMTVQAFVLDHNQNVIRETKPIEQTKSNNYAVAQTNNGPFMPTCYFGGVVQLKDRDGRGYSPRVPGLKYENGEFTDIYDTSGLIRSTSELPTNNQGLTYGSILDGDIQKPDLIAAVGMNGNVGYAKRQQLCPTFYNSKAFERYNIQLEESNYQIPLYDLEGNQIDWFVLDDFDEAEANPIVQKRIQEISSLDVPVAQDMGPLTGYEIDPLFAQEFSGGLVNGDFPKNAKGETFGSVYNQYVAGYAPDYIACVGDNDVSGYMRYSDHINPKSDSVNVYDMNGNVIGQFTFDSGIYRG
ncbi:hypothetical protein [uncultured Phocaeicola sp.]|uniref:hypothetical protein n=1 Tax=uncultured Phocaeicola sp. TaxID=990718 RepID=UPI0032206359